MKRTVQTFLPVVLIMGVAIMASVAFGTNTPETAEPGGQVDLIKIQRDFYDNPGIKDNMKIIATILFLVIGPLKVVPNFAILTTNADDRLRKQLAFRGFWISTLTIVPVALLSRVLLGNYQISVTALTASAGLVLIFVSLQKFGALYRPQETSPPEKPTLALATFPLSIPVILPPYGFAIVMLLMWLGSKIDASALMILGVVVMWMVVNYLLMLGVRPIMKVFKLPFWRVADVIKEAICLALGITLLFYALEIEALSIWKMIQD